MNNVINSIITVAQTRFKHTVTDEEKQTIKAWVDMGATEKMVTEALATTYNNGKGWNMRYTNRVVENMIKDGINDNNLDEYRKKHSQHSNNKNNVPDKVAVVRCKDCKRSERKSGQHYNCSLFKHNMCEDDYCSLGSPKT